MIARSLLLAVCVAALLPRLSRAQEAAQPGVSSEAGAAQPAVSSAAVADSTADRKMYEDIEILRRILDRKLHTLYPPTATLNNIFLGVTQPNAPLILPNPNMGPLQPYGQMNGRPLMLGIDYGSQYHLYTTQPNNFIQTQEISYQLEGVYLKGQGVVYTVTLPTLQASTKVKKPAKPISEWESVRREFHKEKEPPKKSDEGKEAGVREVLLKLLAENGHHFSRLGENESLTLVITVHEESKPQPPRKSEKKPAKPESNASTAKALASALDSPKKANDFELLGDLHLKQGRSEDAITAFQKAVELVSDSKQKAALHRKLAQAYLMQEKMEKARSHLDQALTLYQEALDAKNKPAPAAKPEATPLPVKMIISVPKKLLDQASDGKITFEEFCRQASVETLRFEEPKR
ncbi:MAG TPA: tetratricopeptide repeat protein [Gemmataceae bacterium]